ncbi:PTS sugar transporter subunit IIC [Ligilactobacillus ceti]|uniref:Permease IIC component n=1 Tax=Ligilactobacillus ceti DSM 22408 TaxID=1122146 RepID=A0A0R2KIV1_9LACO|nr:PTS transporter subunit EIIC [Ligilactobacillus ceti]KRN89326.1 cellobiose-specific PTS system IIC component [Ligilactobacillus ceti DSM 22408]
MVADSVSFKDKVFKVVGKISSSRHMVALRDGIAQVVPLLIIGSLFMIIGQFPIKGYLDFMAKTFGSNWNLVIQQITFASFSLMGLIAVIGISYNLAKSYGDVAPLPATLISMSAFFLTIPFELKKGAFYIPLSQMGATSLFIAILVGLFITDFYVWLVHKDLTIKMPATVPPAVSSSFTSLFPGFFCLVLVWLIRLGVSFTPIETIPGLMQFIFKPLSAVGVSLPGALLCELLISVLWLFGVHGGNVVGGVMMAFWLQAMQQNATAFTAHKELPNIITAQFFDNFVHIGGAGATLGLALLMVLFSKSEEYKTLGRLEIVPALFNINEPIIFGTPIVLNIYLAVPFILAPIANVLITYFAMATGLCAKTIGIMVPWTTPVIISGFLSTGHISGAITQVVCLVVDALIYYYFFKVADRKNLNSDLG